MKILEPTNCEMSKLPKEGMSAFITEIKKLISLSAACEYYLASLCERADATVSFDQFSPRGLSKWSREWASSERFKKKGELQKILYSGLGTTFKANDPVIKNLSCCYIDVAQKLMFYSGEFENSRDYLRTFSSCCRDEVEGSINIESYSGLEAREDSQAQEEHEITLSIDGCFFVVNVKKSSDKEGILIYSIRSQAPDKSDFHSGLFPLTMSYLKDIVGLFACGLWINTTGKQAFKFIEIPADKIINDHRKTTSLHSTVTKSLENEDVNDLTNYA